MSRSRWIASISGVVAITAAAAIATGITRRVAPNGNNASQLSSIDQDLALAAVPTATRRPASRSASPTESPEALPPTDPRAIASPVLEAPATGDTAATETLPPATAPAASPVPVVKPQSRKWLSGEQLVGDDYTSYESTADLRANIGNNLGGTGDPSHALYNDGAGAQFVFLDPDVTYKGHATVRYSQPGGNTATPELWVNFPNGKTVRKFWFRAKLRWSDGYTTQGTSAGGQGYKIFGWGWQGADSRGSLELSDGSEGNVYLTWNVVTNGAGHADDLMGGRINDEWRGQGWYDYIICYEQLDATHVRQRFWLAADGQAPQLRIDQRGTMQSGTVPAVNRIMLGMNFNSKRRPNQNQAIWYGQWELIDGTAHPNPFGLVGGG